MSRIDAILLTACITVGTFLGDCAYNLYLDTLERIDPPEPATCTVTRINADTSTSSCD